MENFAEATWRKSQRSGDNGACVEVARSGEMVAIRDSKDPFGPLLVFPAAQFALFLAGVAKDEFTTAC